MAQPAGIKKEKVVFGFVQVGRLLYFLRVDHASYYPLVHYVFLELYVRT